MIERLKDTMVVAVLIGLSIIVTMLAMARTSTPQKIVVEPVSESDEWDAETKMLRSTDQDCTDQVMKAEVEYLKEKFDPLYAMKFDSENPVFIYGYYNGYDLIQLTINPDADNVKLLEPRTNNIWHENSKVESNYKFICYQSGVKYYGLEILFRIGSI